MTKWKRYITYASKRADEYVKRLKSFRPIKQEWSEEDEKKLCQIIETLLADKEVACRETPQHYNVLCKAYDELISWLKFLRPQYHGDVTMTEAYKMGLEAGKASSWKPSKEQMDSLERAIILLEKQGHFVEVDILKSIQRNLKKL